MHTLKFQDVLESTIMISGITIVKSTVNKAVAIVLATTKTYTSEYDEGHECDKSNNDKFVKYAV